MSNTQSVPVLLLHAQPEPILARMAASLPDLQVVTCRSYEALPDALAEVQPEVAFAFKIRGPFPREALFGAASLRWVQASGAGIDHLVPWDETRVTVTNASGVHGDLMAQYTIWAILNHRLGLPGYAAAQAQHHWQKRGHQPVAGTTLTIVGFGQIGSEIARLARTLGMKVIGVRRHPEPSPDADEVVGLDRLHDAVARADYVSVVLPLTAETRSLIDADVFAAMQPGAYLVNTGRGGIVDETALLAALRSGHLGGALLDVFATEPLPADHPLWDAPNVIVLPHASGDTADWEMRVVDLFCRNYQRWHDGLPLFNVVDPHRGY